MKHELYDVTNFDIVGPYTLKVTFNDNETQVINFEPTLHGALFGPLRDLNVFNQVKIDAEVKTLVWPNGADFDPETLHNWPRYKDTLIKRAKSWSEEPSNSPS